MKSRALLVCVMGLIGSGATTAPQAAGSIMAVKTAPTAAESPGKAAVETAPAKAMSAAASTPDAAERPIPNRELAGIYSGKTWLWPDGAAYFAPGGRFVAWAGTGKAASFATGSWSTPGNGRLCFRAFWVSRAGAAPAESCFGHMSKSGHLFQRKEPSGEWFVFKHPTTQAGDEFLKIVPGDKAGAEMEKIREIFRRG